MAIVTGNELGLAFCKVLKLDPTTVGKMIIDSTPGEIAKITIERLVTEEETEKLAIVLTEYALVDAKPIG